MNEQRPVGRPSSKHNNADLLVWACYVIGGFERWVDVEELYLKVFELGPARLSWRTRPDLPDYKKCAKALQELEDPKRSDHLGLFAKQGKYTRKLTVEGLEWCRKYESLLISLYGHSSVPNAAIQGPSRTIRTIEEAGAFRAFQATGIVTSEKWELAEALRCMIDSKRHVWDARLDQVAAAAEANGRLDVLEFVARIRVVIAGTAEN